MNDLQDVLSACREADRDGEPAVLATVVRVLGSSYRRPGARMLFRGSRPAVGLVGGGCLESDLAARARQVLESGRSETLIYDVRSPDDILWGLGLGCNGAISVLLERLQPGSHPSYLQFLENCSRERRAAVLALCLAGKGAWRSSAGQRLMTGSDHASAGSLGDEALERAVMEDAVRVFARKRSAARVYEQPDARAEVFLEYVSQSVSLVIFGAGGDAQPLVRLARELGWRVSVVDNRPAFATPGLFPEADDVRLLSYGRLGRSGLLIDGATAVMVMTHHFLHDLELLEFLLPGPAPYIGLLGPRKRRESLLHELAQRGFHATPLQLRRLHGPAGIDIGAETSQEIALAVLAEIQAVLAGAAASFLRDRPGPLHDESS